MLALPLAFFTAGGAARAQVSFNDMGGIPEEIRQAVEYAVQAGYMEGFPDGGFHPAEAATRLDCARALVSVFGHAEEETDPGISFSDLSPADPRYAWANLAVKHGIMDPLPDGSFAPQAEVLFRDLVTWVCAGLEMEEAARNVDRLTGGDPPCAGAMVVFMDLHLKYRYSKVWPDQAYPRGELAFTLYRLDCMESWRPWYVEQSFCEERSQLPPADEDQLQALRYGFQRLGCPYVYGGERESEGGFDCSGFVYNTLSMRMGYPMMRVADDQARDARYLYVSRQALQPGDAVFFYQDDGEDPSRYIGHAGMYVGNGLFIHSTGSNGGVSLDCLDENGYWDTHFAWGRRVVGGPYHDRFDTWLLLYNPGDGEMPVRVTYLRPARGPETRDYRIRPHSRYTVCVDDLYAYDEVSMEVEAPAPGVVAERAMYFNYRDWADDGHASQGTEEPTLQGYFAEGYTGDGFHTWLLMVNPEDRTASVEVTYLREGADPVVEVYELAPHSRFTVFVNQVEGLGKGSVGMSYRSLNGVPVAAERSLYFDYRGKRGGHCSTAVTELSERLYLAEGYTGGDFDTWILLANPNPQAAEVEVTYLVQEGRNLVEKLTVPARSRYTINAREKVPGVSFGTAIRSLNGVGLVAERAMYFDYHGKRGGHCSAAADAPSQTCYFAEGYTGGDFDTWILLANPNPEPATATLTFAREDGSEVVLTRRIPAASRCSVHADEVAGLEGCSFAAKVEGDLPLFAERSMYFDYRGRCGGSNCTGVPRPSQHRFFAEGYTGG